MNFEIKGWMSWALILVLFGGGYFAGYKSTQKASCTQQ